MRLGHGGDGAGAGGKLEGVREPLRSFAEKAGVGRDDTLSGFWYFRKGSESARLKHVERAGVDEKVVYCLHGGGFFVSLLFSLSLSLFKYSSYFIFAL